MLHSDPEGEEAVEALNEESGGLVKPDIVFFGENLPRRFFERTAADLPACDLLVVMGTSLVVQPFASMIDEVAKDCPRLLINREKAGTVSPLLAYLGVSETLCGNGMI